MGDGSGCWECAPGKRILCCANGQVRLAGEVSTLLQLTFPYAVPRGTLLGSSLQVPCHLSVDGTFSLYSVGCGVMEQPVGFLEI